MIALRPLAELAAAPPRQASAPRCEVCGAEIGDVHRHLVELGTRGVTCACQGCAVLFTQAEPPSRYRTVPDRILVDASFELTPDRLGIPVGLAYCFRNSASGRAIVCYPGPAGTVDAELPDLVWETLAAATPLAGLLEPDVEALLFRGERGAPRVACYLVPISSVYELTSRLRASWRGFTGGDEANRELVEFFAELDRKGRKR